MNGKRLSESAIKDRLTPEGAQLRASLLALMPQLERSQWLSRSELETQQYTRLEQVLAHAAQSSAYYESKLKRSGLPLAKLSLPEVFRELPILTRRDLQTAGGSLFCIKLPREHLPVGETRTSGSTGESVVVLRTAQNQLYWLANVLREHQWFERDSLGSMAAIRVISNASPSSLPDWGPPLSLIYQTGPSCLIPITLDIAKQIEILQQIQPNYLLTYPTNLSALVQEMRIRGIAMPELRQILTVGETLGDEVRTLVNDEWGVAIADSYSSQEAGIIAVQCPVSGLYHVMAESLIVEVLDQAGHACAPGETGRVVVTDLHNFATPLIRYDIGDYAEVGPECPCGRGLPTLRRILGRERNMVQLPNGERHWPLVGAHYFHEIAPIRQYQVVQRSLELIEVRLVADRKLIPAEESRLEAMIHKAMGHPFQLRFVYFDNAIPRSPGGKYEEFLCEVK